ncbi:DNA-3-methyladenine glycosylase family protein [Mucilaginibacter sp. SP1R1]|uniref:DNA-3-methyladenine glycosylase family protein n=1 Tax=Mucilaginibacter sp. SP1R1 TaxID=2723091 RepID=UPI00160BF363|nr:DNA-3-methyladenine glycosylase 2 family protein [Mucilaginibacter sp. SP1R1]MBB6148560.1 DNA-3-methyladenine glycosylase II [Mucilaginibacter sp. SP1R1]
MTTLLIPKPPLFSFKECLWFLNRSYDDCLYHITDNSVTKAILIDEQTVVITVTEDQENIVVNVLTGRLPTQSKTALSTYIDDWFDLQRNIEPFYKLLSAHPSLGYMATDFAGLRLMNIPDVFEAICWSIIGQQINLTFAYKLKRAIVEKYGTYIVIDGVKHYTFPKPAVLALLSIEDLKALQFSRQKADYIITLAKLFEAGEISKAQLLQLSSADKVKTLVSLKGIGIWTANYVLMKSLNDTNGIPHGDVGLLKALEDHALIINRKDDKAIAHLFSQFPGWQSYLVHYLWRSLAIPKS